MKNLVRLLLLGLLTISAFSTTAQDDSLTVVASHSILADVVSNVAGDAATVTSTMPVGSDPHTYEPVPSDLGELAEADVVFINGGLFEEGLLEVIENVDEDLNLVTVSQCVEMIGFVEGGHDHEEGEDHDHEEGEDHDHEEGEDHDHEEGEDHDHSEEAMVDSDIAALCEAHIAEITAIHEASHDEDHDHEDGEEDHDHGEGDDHDHGGAESLGLYYASECAEAEGHSHGEGDDHDHGDEDHAEGDHDHDHGPCDPHVWMEPHNVMYWTMTIRDTLIELDPANADVYTANAEAYLIELDMLAHEFIMPLVETVPEENRVLVTSHDSLGYFANRFDFEIVTTIIPSVSTAGDPSAADIAEVIETIRDEEVPAVFGETTVSDAVIQLIAEEAEADFFILYTGSLSDADGPASTYIEYMRYNITTIVEALGGGME